MGRRDALLLLCGAAVATPRAAAAQTPTNVYRIGLLTSLAPMAENSPPGILLIRALARLGYSLGINVVFERRGAEAQLNRLPRLVDELVASKVDVIVAIGYPQALAAKQGTFLPVVVLSAGDPVGTGLVESLARPGGHVTGISDVATDLTAKRLGFLKEIAPGLRRVAMLWNADDFGMTLRHRAAEDTAKALGFAVLALGVREPNDFEQAFAAMKSDRPDAILMVSDSLIRLNRRRIFDFAAEHLLPAIYEDENYVRDGGLMSYAADSSESFERIAALLDRIRRGTKPADLAIEQPTRFRFVINLKTAKALGLTVPLLVLAQADEIIE